MESTPLRIEHTAARARRSRDRGFLLVLAEEGNGVVHQAGSAISFGSGDFFLLDTGKPYRSDYQTSTRMLTLTMPKQAILSRSPAAKQLAPLPFDTTSALGPVISPLLQSLPSAFGQVDTEISTMLTHNIYDLLGTAINERASKTAQVGSALAAHRSDLHRAKEYFTEQLHDPELTLQGAGTELGLSLRYLHQLFREEASTPQAWIYIQRLERAARMLGLHDGAPVADIAFATGFKDPSHFSRAFKNHFGTPPSSYRSERALASPYDFAPQWAGQQPQPGEDGLQGSGYPDGPFAGA